MISIIAVVTLFDSTAAFSNAYSTFADAGSIGLGSFIDGSAQLMSQGLMIPTNVASTIISVIVISFAATSLDTSVRLMRYIISELGSEYKLPKLTKVHAATSIAVISSAALTLLPQGPKGFGSGGYLLWPLFGTSNQLLAGISLLLISIWLKKRGSNYIFTLIPMVFLMFMTVWAMFTQVFLDWSGAGVNDFKPILFIFGSIILVFAIWIVIEAFSAFNNRKNYGNIE